MRTTFVSLLITLVSASAVFAHCDGSDSTLAPGSLSLANGCGCLTVVQSGDTCGSIIDPNQYPGSLSLSDFYAVNPSVDTNNCPNLQVGSSYCTAPPTNESPDAFTIDQGCRAYYLVQDGDYCQAIADQYKISLQEFYRINPGVNSNDCSNLYSGEQYCVQVLYDLGAQPTSAPTTKPSKGKPHTTKCPPRNENGHKLVKQWSGHGGKVYCKYAHTPKNLTCTYHKGKLISGRHTSCPKYARCS